MLNCLQFNMSVPTPFVFLQRFLKAAQADKKVKILSFSFSRHFKMEWSHKFVRYNSF